MKYGDPLLAESSAITPIPEMANQNADVTLVVIQKNYVLYLEPVNDTLLSAHRVRAAPMRVGGNCPPSIVRTSPSQLLAVRPR